MLFPPPDGPATSTAVPFRAAAPCLRGPDGDPVARLLRGKHVDGLGARLPADQAVEQAAHGSLESRRGGLHFHLVVPKHNVQRRCPRSIGLVAAARRRAAVGGRIRAMDEQEVLVAQMRNDLS